METSSSLEETPENWDSDIPDPIWHNFGISLWGSIKILPGREWKFFISFSIRNFRNWFKGRERVNQKLVKCKSCCATGLTSGHSTSIHREICNIIWNNKRLQMRKILPGSCSTFYEFLASQDGIYSFVCQQNRNFSERYPFFRWDFIEEWCLLHNWQGRLSKTPLKVVNPGATAKWSKQQSEWNTQK